MAAARSIPPPRPFREGTRDLAIAVCAYGLAGGHPARRPPAPDTRKVHVNLEQP